MELLNDSNTSQKVTKKAQEDNQTNSTTFPSAEQSIEDMELNEEQLDIISGGGGGPIRE